MAFSFLFCIFAAKIVLNKQNMKQFSLEEYLKNPLRKVITRDGLNATIICTDKKDSKYPIVALIETKTGGEFLQCYTKDGTYYIDTLCDNDLYFLPEKYEGWINLYKCTNSTQCYTSNPFDSEEKAIELGKMSDNYLKTVKIEWEA